MSANQELPDVQRKKTIFSHEISKVRGGVQENHTKKAPKRLLVAPSQKVASLISNSHILGSQPASEPAKRMTGLFYTRSVSLGKLGRLGEA